MLEEWHETVPAVLLAWYPGMEGGRAIADLLLGTAEPGGRLPFAIPAHKDDLPEFDPTADSVRYDEWWGQRLLDKRAAEPAYPFGFGLGYSRVEFSNPKIFMVGEQSAMEVTARNCGDRATATIAQAYAHDATSQALVPIRRLVGFARVALEPEETKQVRIPLDLTALHHRIAPGEWTRRDGDWRIAVASHSRDTGTDTCAVF